MHRGTPSHRAILLRLLAALFVLLPGLPTPAASGVPPLPLLADGTTTRISTRLNGRQAPAGTDVREVSVSGNGRYAVFYSTDTPGFPACHGGTFLRDLVTGRLEMVSVPASGCHKGRRPSGGSAHSYTSISHDGRWVAFGSSAKDLVRPPLPARSPTGMQTLQIFLRDRHRGRTVLVSVGVDGRPANSSAAYPAVSDDGRWVAFQSAATNLVKGDLGDPDNTVLRSDVFLRDLHRGVTVRVGPDLRRAGRGPKYYPSLSGDGRWVAFDTIDGDLAPHKGTGGGVLEDRRADNQVWVWDRITRRIELVSRSAAGYAAAGLSTLGGLAGSKISRDGRWIVYQSDAANIVGPNSGLREPQQVYLYDRLTKTPLRVTDGRAGEGGLGESEQPCLSPDGRFVSFASAASNLADGDLTPGYIHGVPDVGTDILLWDRATRTTRVVSRSTEGLPADRNSRESCPSSGGRSVVFISDATTLVVGDTNTAPDVFARQYPGAA